VGGPALRLRVTLGGHDPPRFVLAQSPVADQPLQSDLGVGVNHHHLVEAMGEIGFEEEGHLRDQDSVPFRLPLPDPGGPEFGDAGMEDGLEPPSELRIPKTR